MATTKQWTLVSMNPVSDEYWQIHKHECADAVRYAGSHGPHLVNTVEGCSPEDVIEKELADELQGMGYDEGCFRVMPCCK